MSKILIPSHYTDREKHLDALAQESSDRLSSSIWGAPILNPMLCDERFLDALGAFYGIDVEDFEPEKKRTVIAASIPARRIRGTPGAVKMLLESAGIECTIDEDTGTPFTFEISLGIADDVKRLSSVTKLIDLTKNARSHYLVDFDYETDARYLAGSASITEMDLHHGLDIETESAAASTSAPCFRFDPVSHPIFERSANTALAAAAAIDYEAHTPGMEVVRSSVFHATSAGIMRIDMGQAGADVMHLPIPPVVIGAHMAQTSGAVFAISFGLPSGDLWHLDHHLDHHAESEWLCNSGGCVFGGEYESVLSVSASALYLIDGSSTINLDI